jgi:hypothetical protein
VKQKARIESLTTGYLSERLNIRSLLATEWYSDLGGSVVKEQKHAGK